MNFVFPMPPAGAAECVTTFIQNALDVQVFERLPRLFHVDLALARISPAFGTYRLDKEALQGTETVSEARFIAWQYLLFSANSPITDLGVLEEDGKLVVSHMRGDSTLAQSAVQAMRLAEADETTDSQVYEFRMLRVPCVRFVGAWLHREDDDIVIPIGHTSTPGLAVHKFYSGKETLDLLKAEHAAVLPAAFAHS